MVKMIAGDWLLLLIIVIFFLNRFSAIAPYLTLVIFPLLIIKNGFWRYLDTTCLWIIVFSLTYSIISTIYGFNVGAKGNMLFFLVFPLMFYVTGRYLMNTWYAQKYFFLLLLIVPIALLVFSSVITDILQGGFQNTSRDVFVNGLRSSTTLYGVRLSLSIVSIGMIFSITQNREEKIYKYLLIALGVLGIICTIYMINRTGIVIAVVSCLTIFIVNILKFRIQSIIIYMILLAFVGYELYPVVSKSKILESYLNREGENGGQSNTAGGRTLRWEDGIVKIFEQPTGGGVFQNGRRYYAHNFWLDVSEIAGVLPLIALLGCTFINLKKNYRIIRSRRISPFLSSWLIALNIGFFLTCCVEPIMEGIASYAYLYFFFWGMTSMIYDRIQIANESNYNVILND